MATCPSGHESETTDYCDVCGAPIAVSAVTSSGLGASSPSAGLGRLGGDPAAGAPVEPPETCAVCGAERFGRFCEACGHDLTEEPTAAAAGEIRRPGAAETGRSQAHAPVAGPAPQGTWTAVIRADAAYFARVRAKDGPDAEDIEFPPPFPERRVPLTGSTARIGRRSTSHRIAPEIDLAGPPLDPGVSRLHALLVARPDGGWSLVDSGSANGTTLNDGEEPIEEGVPVALLDGDRIHVGAWTTIELSRGV